MKHLTMLLAAVVVSTTGVAADMKSEDKQGNVQVAVKPATGMAEIEVRIASSRKFVQQLVNNNEHVLRQFDAFTHTLSHSYKSGEGFIVQDIYKIVDAISFAADKHRSQTRKDHAKTPYIIHPMGVANHLMHTGHVRDPDIIIAALLHDTVEDTATTFEEIEAKFGMRVAGFVKEVTDDKSLPPEERKRLQIAHAAEKSAGAAEIKLADKLYNLSNLVIAPPVEWEKARIDAYFTWAESVVNSLPWVNGPLKHAVGKCIQEYWESQQPTAS
jgi:hypothetical protein